MFWYNSVHTISNIFDKYLDLEWMASVFCSLFFVFSFQVPVNAGELKAGITKERSIKHLYSSFKWIQGDIFGEMKAKKRAKRFRNCFPFKVNLRGSQISFQFLFYIFRSRFMWGDLKAGLTKGRSIKQGSSDPSSVS